MAMPFDGISSKSKAIWRVMGSTSAPHCRNASREPCSTATDSSKGFAIPETRCIASTDWRMLLTEILVAARSRSFRNCTNSSKE
jgi:hypothetical protein